MVAESFEGAEWSGEGLRAVTMTSPSALRGGGSEVMSKVVHGPPWPSQAN
jgi:hypothetical protein